MFGFLGDNVDSVKQAAEVNNTGKSEPEQGAEAGLGLPSLGGFWNVAKAVQSAVQQTADEVVRSVQQTDWKSELAAFTHEVEAEAHKAVEVVQHLPAQLHTITAETGDEASGAEGASPGPGSSSSTVAGSAQPFGAVGSSLANFGKQLISGTKEVIDTVTDLVEGEIATAAREVPRFAGGSKGSSTGGRGDAASRLASRQRLATKYSRFEAEVAAMQRDSATYVDEPEDAEDFAAWRSSFSMSSAQPDIDKILSGNAFMSELQSRLVPLLVEKEEFWARYFYRLYKLQQKEEQRQQLAVRAKQLDDSEDLGGWDDDDSPHQPAAAAAAAATAQQQQEQQQEQEHTQQAEQQQQEGNGQEAEVQEQPQQPELSTSAKAAGEPVQESPHAGGSSSSADHEAAPQQQAAQATAAPGPADVDTEAPDNPAVPSNTAAAVAALTASAAAATAAISGPVSRKASEDSSFPSTPMQVGSDASDAALVTDTVSDGSGATAAGSAQPWTVVSPRASPAAAATAAVQPQSTDGAGDAAAAAAEEEEEVQDAAQLAAPQQQQEQQQHTGQSASSSTASAPKALPSKAAGAGAVAPKAPAAGVAAATAAAAAAVGEDDDDDWGDDADDAVAAVAASKAGAAGAAAAAAAEGDDDWGNWE